MSYIEDVRAEREADALLEAGVIVRCEVCGWNNPAGQPCEDPDGHPGHALKTFTVYGVWNNDGPGQDTDELIIAAVVEGEHLPVDDGEGSDFTRYATVVQARDAAEAESLAGS